MPERTIHFGAYGARGIKGHEAVARQLDALAGFIATPITQKRGLMARLHYLTRSDHARQSRPRRWPHRHRPHPQSLAGR